MTLAEMLAEASGGNDDAPKILPEAAIMRLREGATRYADQLNGGPRFQIGDVVTPAAGSHLVNEGSPHIVVEIRPGAEPDFSLGDIATVEHGCRLDMRVLSIAGSQQCVAAHWVESWVFELWPVS